MEITYFEDIPLNEKETVGQYTVTKEEMVDFARKWDPLPMHIDEHAAESNKHDVLIRASLELFCMLLFLS